MMCEPLTEIRGEELLTWYLAGFHARTSQSPAKEKELKVNEVGYGQSKQGSFVKYSHDSRIWKIAQLSLLEDLELSLETWPKWGSMQNGECFHAQMSVEFTYENESGLSLPTPCSQDTSSKKIPDQFYIGANGLPKHLNHAGMKSQVPLSQALKIMMTLPTIGANEGKGSSKVRYIGSKDFHGAKMSEGLRTCESDPIYLNPLFAELVMMWPLGWTDLKPLAMDKFQDWLKQHGKY
jgi:hypothetical protein